MMKILKLMSLLLFITNCFSSTKINAQFGFDKIRKALKSSKYELSELKEEYPFLNIYEYTITADKARSDREKAAVLLKKNKLTPVIENENGHEGFMKVKDIKRNDLMRVSYIYLEDHTKNGKKLADSILLEHKKGVEFEDLARKYSKDPNASYGGGDLGWFKETDMLEDFSKAVKRRSKGKIFKVQTKELGWFVVLVTEERKKRLEYHLIAVGEKGREVIIYQ